MNDSPISDNEVDLAEEEPLSILIDERESLQIAEEVKSTNISESGTESFGQDNNNVSEPLESSILLSSIF